MASVNFINECKNSAYCNRYGKLEFTNPSLEINQSNKLQEFSIDSGCYDNGEIVGTVYVKKLDAQLIDALDDTIENRQFDASVGVTYQEEEQDVTEYEPMGSYVIEKPKDEQTENYTSFVAYDLLMQHLEDKYQTQLDYENNTITLSDVYDELCDNLGLTPVTTTFTNSTIEVEGNPFSENDTNRMVLNSIAKVACSFVDIDYDTNEIDLKWLSNTLNYTFQTNDYSTLEGGKTIYGPINSLIIKSSVADSENVSVDDPESIALNGEHQLVITEDYFLYDAEKREEAITAIWNKVNGLTYTECTLTTYTGKPFLKIGDKIRIYKDDENYIDSYVLQNQFTYDGAFTNIIKCPVLTEQQIQTKQDVSLGDALRLTQIVVDKQNGTITSVVSKTETIEGQTQNAINIATGANNLANNVDSDLQSYKSTVSSQFQQTANSFEMRFDEVQDLIDEVSDTEAGHYNEFHKYIRFVNGVIILGEEGNQLTAELSNTKLSFKQNGTEIAYVSNNKLYITNAEILTNVIIGNFQFIPRSNGSLSFRKVS